MLFFYSRAWGDFSPERLELMHWAKENYQTIKGDRRLIAELVDGHEEKCEAAKCLGSPFVILAVYFQYLYKSSGQELGSCAEVIFLILSIVFSVFALGFILSYVYHSLARLNPQAFRIDTVLDEIYPDCLSSLRDRYSKKQSASINDEVVEAIESLETMYVDG